MTTTNVKISPSIIATDFSNMGAILNKMDSTIIDLLHMDVMDGNFVPNLTFGPSYIKNLKAHTSIPLDVHLMIESPENSLDQYIEINPWCITLHYESTRFPTRLLQEIKQSGIKPALAINPATPVEAIFDLLPYVELALVMSVDPGYYGQLFLDVSLKRIEKLSTFINNEGLSGIEIQVDGGITSQNIASVVSKGASVIVTGNAVFKDGDINNNVLQLKKNALKMA